MEKNSKFPLVFWQETEEYKREERIARTRLEGIKKRLEYRGFACNYLGSLRFDRDCVAEFWLNDSMPLLAGKRCRDYKDALGYALKHGSAGWWTLEDLEQFSQGRGLILEQAMWKLGYRRHRVSSARWAKRRKIDGNNEPGHEIPIQVEEIEVFMYSDMANSLFVLPNYPDYGAGKVYIVEVNGRGLIYFSFWIDPFAATRLEHFPIMAGQMNMRRAHLLKEQDGFIIEAKNINVGNEQGVFVKAIRSDGFCVEVAWPRLVVPEKVSFLAHDLVARING